MGVGDILRRNATRFSGKEALIYTDQAVSYKDLNERVNCLANSLLDMGINKGDRVAVMLHACPQLVEIYFASAKMGTIFVPINNLLKEQELEKLLQYISPRVFFVDPDYEPLIASVRKGLTSTEFIIGLPGVLSKNFTAYTSLIDGRNQNEPKVMVSDDDVLNMILTSGTTGQPKGALRTHRQNIMNSFTEVVELALMPSDRALYASPPYHVIFDSILLRHFLAGNTIVMIKEGGFDAKRILGLLSEEKITVFQTVPTSINILLQESDIDRYDLTSLRLLVYSSSPMPTALLEKAMRRFNCKFMQFYGQTESGPTVMILGPDDHLLDGSKVHARRLTSAGLPVLYWRVRIVNEEEKDVAPDEVGEILVQTDAMLKEYWNLPDATASALRGGWLHTGDMGKFDEDGYVYLVDRKNDMIISGGRNIYPREIEEVLYRHSAVLEASVIGVPDNHWVEAVKAIVVLKDGMAASEQEIIDFCKRNLASYKKPQSVEFREALPKGPTGKILKRQIREEYWKHLDRQI